MEKSTDYKSTDYKSTIKITNYTLWEYQRRSLDWLYKFRQSFKSYIQTRKYKKLRGMISRSSVRMANAQFVPLHGLFYFVFLLMFLTRGLQCFFIKHRQSGLCLYPKDDPPKVDSDNKKVYFMQFQEDKCLHANAQFHFNNEELLINNGRKGTCLAIRQYATRFLVYHGITKRAIIYSKQARFVLKQTKFGSLSLYKDIDKKYCAYPENPTTLKDSYLIRSTQCDEEKQKFVFGSVTDERQSMTDVNCSPKQVMKVVKAEYGGFNSGIFDYNKDANCSLPSTCIVKSQCDNKTSCNMNVNNRLFKHDPCPGKAKKLYIEYVCVDSLTKPITKAPYGPPLNVVFYSKSTTTLAVSWNAKKKSVKNGNIDRYKVCYSSLKNIETCVDVRSRTNYTIKSLLPATKYFVKVAAGTSVGFGNFSEEIINFTNQELLPGPPTNLQIVEKGSRSVKISWEAPVIKGEGTIFYIITERQKLFNKINQTQLEKNLTGLKPNTRYSVKVSSTNNYGKRESAYKYFTTLEEGSCPHLKDGSAEGRGAFSWPETKVGSRATVACPRNHTVLATRKCQYKDNKIVWGPVDDKFCPFLHKKSQSIFDLSEENVSSSNAVEVGEQIKNLTYYGEKLIPEDVDNVASVLEKIVAVKEKADEVADNVFSTIDNVLEASLDVLRTGQRRTNASRSIVHSLNTLLEALNITKEGSFRRTLNNFAVDLTVVSPRSFTGVTFYGIATSALTNNSIVMEQSNNKTLSVAKATVIYIPQTLFNETTSVNFSQTETVVIVLYKETKFFTVFSSEPNNFSQNLNSYVIAGSIKARTISNLKSPIVLTYPSLKRGDKQSASCVFWNFIHESWSDEGCSFHDVLDDGRVVCHCNHLTNFAMLMDIFADDKTAHEEILSLISYIGCALSLIGLVLTIITILLFKDLRNKTPNQILLNFCIALCLTLVVFLVAAERSNTSSMARCRAAAVALHYFVLVAFMWMAIEAFNMYLLFVKIIPSNFSKFIQKCCLVAWGSPAILVSITVGVAHGYYGDNKYCRVHGPAFFISFLTPVLLILVGNSIAFVLIFRSLLSSESKIVSNRKVSGYQQARRGAAILALLGLTWTFGVFAINDAKVVFQYLFCIFNSLQGFLVFVFFCVLPSTTRNKCKNFLPKKKSKRSTEQNTNVESGIKLNVISKETETSQLVSA